MVESKQIIKNLFCELQDTKRSDNLRHSVNALCFMVAFMTQLLFKNDALIFQHFTLWTDYDITTLF